MKIMSFTDSFIQRLVLIWEYSWLNWTRHFTAARLRDHLISTRRNVKWQLILKISFVQLSMFNIKYHQPTQSVFGHLMTEKIINVKSHLKYTYIILKEYQVPSKKQGACNNTFDSVIDPLSLDGLILKPIKLFVYRSFLVPTLACQF